MLDFAITLEQLLCDLDMESMTIIFFSWSNHFLVQMQLIDRELLQEPYLFIQFIGPANLQIAILAG